MAGGNGTRLWPMSRGMYPKQFLALAGNETLLQQTVKRGAAISDESPIIICNEEHRFIVAEQLRQVALPNAEIILEPTGRNTAPAIALAALCVQRKYEDAILVVLSADHHIPETDAFSQAMRIACDTAGNGAMVTFGIKPTKPETGYGYIKQGEARSHSTYEVEQFVEKPDQSTAQSYLDSGCYLWNSGMFVFTASVYLNELHRHREDIYSVCAQAMESASLDMDFVRPDPDVFKLCPEESVDYAVMEKTDRAIVLPYLGGWSDVGSWDALWDINQKDANDSVIKGDVIQYNSTGNYIHSEDKLVATLGVNNLVIVDTKDALLVTTRDEAQNIKKLVAEIKKAHGKLTTHHREVYRPWGVYDSIDEGHRYQVKRITVKPGAKLSLQMHHHRAEHWIVVKGTASVTIGDSTKLLSENESVYIPIGITHSLENPGKIPLELIEVQSGSYLGEDDIVRFEDKYGRV